MPPVCPSCDIALDPTHAPVARIRGARVVTYCSIECADAPAGSRKPAPEPEAPAEEVTSEAEASPSETVVAATRANEDSAESTRPRSATEEGERVDERGISASLRKRVLLASGAIMVGGMAIAIVQSVSPSSPSSVSAGHLEAGPAQPRAVSEPAVEPAAEPKPAADAGERSAPPTKEALRTLSIAALEEQLEVGSTRFQRLAGMALARVKHPGAIKTLNTLLKTETSDLSRIDIAYGLALAGDDAGRSYLVAELESKRRDVRIDAARRLVQLGDDSGRGALHQMLGVRSHRLGAASVLALLGDEKGKEVLKETFDSSDSSDENRMRAAVGLGLAGDPLGRDLLRKILDEGKYVVDAAGALARLGDEAAIPALQRQLRLTAMRVGAVESLVAMNVEVDVTPLASALLKGNTEGRVAAAEAILVLGK